MIYPHAVWMPGRNAGYASGRNAMQLCVCHYTVGVDSTGIGLDGYFHFLVARDGRVEQYAELDAVTWHAGTANEYGPGVEVEYLPDHDAVMFTPEALDACGRLVNWIAGYGIPLTYHDGDRLDPAWYSGFLAHRSVEQPDGHSDSWPRDDWDAMTRPAGPELPAVQPWEDSDMISMCYNPATEKLVAMAPNGVGQVFFAEQDNNGRWSLWQEVAQGSFALPVRQL